MKLLGRRVIIVGQGVSGQGAKHALDMAGAVSSFYPEGKASAEFMVVSPGIPPDHECFSLKIPVIGEFALGALINDKPVAAVTGTNGKTTVCEMLADMLSAKYKKRCRIWLIHMPVSRSGVLSSVDWRDLTGILKKRSI